jgi:hypothetical protein
LRRWSWYGGGDDNDDGASASPDGGGALATVHTVPPLEPVVRDLVDAYNEATDAGVQLAVTPQDQAVQAVSQGTPAILPGPWLAGVDADNVVKGRNLAIIAITVGNPAQVGGVVAFASDSSLETAICGANSPFGNFAALVVGFGGVQPDPSRVAEGCEAEAVAREVRRELDAALVFRAFVQIPEEVQVVNIPDDGNLVVNVRYAPAKGDASSDSFEGFLASDAAEQILSQRGFLP